MAFNPDNRPVQLYAGEGETVIEKHIESFTGDPKTLLALYNNLIDSRNKLGKTNTELNRQIADLKKDKADIMRDLVRERGERAAERSKLEGEVNSQKGFVEDFAKQTVALKEYQEKVFGVLGRKPGSLIKRVVDIEKFLWRHDDNYQFTYNGREYIVDITNPSSDEQRLFPIDGHYTKDIPIIVKDYVSINNTKFSLDVDGTIHEFEKDKQVPSYYTLEEMYLEIVALKQGVKGIYDALGGSTVVSGVSDITNYLTVGGTQHTLKWLRDNRDSLLKFIGDVAQRLGKTNTAGIVSELDRLLKIQGEWNNLILAVNSVRDIISRLEKRIGVRKIVIMEGTRPFRKSVKKEIKQFFDDIHNALAWTRGADVKWEDDGSSSSSSQ